MSKRNFRPVLADDRDCGSDAALICAMLPGEEYNGEKMLIFAVKRATSAILTGIAVSFVVFGLVSSNGVAIARQLLPIDASPEQVSILAAQLGLDRPFVAQYWAWLRGIFNGDLGQSYLTGESVTSTVVNRASVTITIVAISMLLLVVVSALIGILAAVWGGVMDRVLQFLSVIGGAFPSFIVAVATVFVFAVQWRLFPATGYQSIGQVGIFKSLHYLVLPVFAIVVTSIGNAAQQFRGAVLDVLDEPFIRTLRARGVPERTIVLKHAFKSACSAGLIVLSLQTIILLGGVIVIEKIFAIPGIGLLVLTAALRGDVPVVMGAVLFGILTVVLINFVTDILHAYVNPRDRLVAAR